MPTSNREKLLVRVLVGLGFIIVSFLVPWPFFLFLTFLVFIAYRILPEAFIVAFIFDILYGAPSAKFFGFQLALTALVIALYWVAALLRRKMTAHRL